MDAETINLKGDNMNYKQEAVQGDVIITLIKELPEGLRKVKRKNDRLILAEGEHTGHAHAIDALDAELWEDPKNKELYLRVTDEVRVTHQEHKPVAIAEGIYKVSIVNEYDYFLEEARKVVD